jgi:hypothetical protein
MRALNHDCSTGVFKERSLKAALRWVWFVLAVAVVYGQSTTSLIVNGSFEEGPAVRTFLNLSAGDTSLPGWLVIGEGTRTA